MEGLGFVGGYAGAVRVVREGRCARRRLAVYSVGKSGRKKDAEGLGKEDTTELDDYRAGDRFRDLEADWYEVEAEDGEELAFVEVEVDEFGMSATGEDVVEEGMPLVSDAKRKQKGKYKDRNLDEKKPRKKHGTHRLLGALKVCKVAASETCEYLISAGFVTVNGEQTKDKSKRVDLRKDVITVNGMHVNTQDVMALVERAAFNKKGRGKSQPEAVNEEDIDILPKSQRDFRESKFVQRNEQGDEFRGREIDGGFVRGRGRKPPSHPS